MAKTKKQEKVIERVQYNEWGDVFMGRELTLEEQLKERQDRCRYLESRKNELQHWLDHEKIKTAYLEGQLEVFKRESGRYPEIYPTREEYKNRRNDVISSSTYDELPF